VDQDPGEGTQEIAAKVEMDRSQMTTSQSRINSAKIPLGRFAMLGGALLLFALLFASCEPNRVYEKNLALPSSWSWTDSSFFEVEITDTSSLYDLYVNVRHSDSYDYSNIWFYIETLYPNGRRERSRVQLQMLDSDGRPRGQCSASLCFYRDLIGSQKRFPYPGQYRFVITQDMRDNPLIGIHDIGLRIEKLGIR
jgi:gliding motility-associated lipoprotein GldH